MDEWDDLHDDECPDCGRSGGSHALSCELDPRRCDECGEYVELGDPHDPTCSQAPAEPVQDSQAVDLAREREQ